MSNVHIRTEDFYKSRRVLEKFNETLFGNLVKSNHQIKNIFITDCNAGMLKLTWNILDSITIIIHTTMNLLLFD